MDYVKKYGAFALLVLFVIGLLFGVPRTTSYLREEAVKTYKQEAEAKYGQYEKQISNERTAHEEQLQKMKLEFSQKESTFQSQIKDLRSKSRITYIKVVKPDGTIEERRVEQSEVIDVTTNITQIKKEYDLKLQDEISRITEETERSYMIASQTWREEKYRLEEEIRTIKEQKTTSVNPRQLRAEIGLLNDMTAYIHGSYDLIGPFFIGSQVERYKDTYTGGLGIGVKF